MGWPCLLCPPGSGLGPPRESSHTWPTLPPTHSMPPSDLRCEDATLVARPLPSSALDLH